jgi:hypothetical protein
MAIMGETVNLVNRTSKPLTVRYDGRKETIAPGENPGFPKEAVLYAKRQNPLMGSEDPENPTMSGTQYLVGVKVKAGERQTDDISPLEQSDAIERFDKKLLRPLRKGEKEVVRPLRNSRASVSVGIGGLELDN